MFSVWGLTRLIEVLADLAGLFSESPWGESASNFIWIEECWQNSVSHGFESSPFLVGCHEGPLSPDRGLLTGGLLLL